MNSTIRSGRKPSAIDRRLKSVRTNNPAPMSISTDTDTWKTTSDRPRSGAAAPSAARPPSLSAAPISTRSDCQIGARLAKTVVAIVSAVESSSTRTSNSALNRMSHDDHSGSRRFGIASRDQ